MPRWLELLSPAFSSTSKGQLGFSQWTGHSNPDDVGHKRHIICHKICVNGQKCVSLMRKCHRSGTSDPYVRVIQVNNIQTSPTHCQSCHNHNTVHWPNLSTPERGMSAQNPDKTSDPRSSLGFRSGTFPEGSTMLKYSGHTTVSRYMKTG